jgi:hypothetical protein
MIKMPARASACKIIMKELYNSCFCILLIVFCIAGCADHTEEINNTVNGIYNRGVFEGPTPAYDFKSDGCSCFPDGRWVVCCVKHDLNYWMGGNGKERSDADLELKRCVSEKGHPVVAELMYYGVRIGGVWWLPTPFRWGFGWKYPQSGPPGKS